MVDKGWFEDFNKIFKLFDGYTYGSREKGEKFELLEKFYKANGVVFERDIVVSGALLHDLGKFTEFALKDGKVAHSDNSFLMRHPLAGAIMAAETGLPDKIVHLIATHSFEGDKSNQTAESYFVRTIDDFVFKCTVFGLRKKG